MAPSPNPLSASRSPRTTAVAAPPNGRDSTTGGFDRSGAEPQQRTPGAANCAAGAIVVPRRLRDAYAEWIGQEPFDVFLTLTAAKRTSPEGMAKRTRWVLNEWGRLLYGKGYRRKGLTIEGVYGIERQGNGNPHSHGVFNFPLRAELSRKHRTEMKMIADSGGFAKIEVPREQADVVSYVCKYVVKEGELFFTPEWTPICKSPTLL